MCMCTESVCTCINSTYQTGLGRRLHNYPLWYGVRTKRSLGLPVVVDF